MHADAIPEEASGVVDQDYYRTAGSLSKTSHGDTAFRRKANGSLYSDLPSLKYKNLDDPACKVTLKAASEGPRPTLPRRPATRTWNATAKERNPLAACLTGPGRAGKAGELMTAKGCRYEGEVLAGRPHGWGKYFVRQNGKANGDWVLEYEGSWIQGIREGEGTKIYPNGEEYHGDFVAGLRHGHGRYKFTSGDCYSGEWVDDQRTGHGTYFYSNGDVHVGNWMRDRKEGRGTLFMMERQRKYVAEYIADHPKCGAVLNIEDADLEPLRGMLSTMSLRTKLDLSSTGTLPPPIPECELLQPNKVLAEQVVVVRRARAEGTKAVRLVQAHSGTLSHKDIEMLRHSFILMAGGDAPKNSLELHQLRELVVMAGLDPASTATRELVTELLERANENTQPGAPARISLDLFMKAVIFFQEASTRVAVDLDDQPEEEEDEEADGQQAYYQEGQEIGEGDEEWENGEAQEEY